jgi:hypothetical protein
MIARATALLSAGALLAAAQTVTPGEPRRPVASWVTNLTRPFALPSLWRDLSTATAEGRSHDATAAARRIASLVPSWDDGAALVGWLIAFDEATDAPGDAARAERVLAAIAWLEDRAGDRRAEDGARAADLLGTAATITEAAFARLPGAADALRAQGLATPAELAADLLRRADALDPTPARAERRALATFRAACAAVRLGDLLRAEAALGAATEQLQSADTAFATSLATALAGLPPLAELMADAQPLANAADAPLLRDLAEALAALQAAQVNR